MMQFFLYLTACFKQITSFRKQPLVTLSLEFPGCAFERFEKKDETPLSFDQTPGRIAIEDRVARKKNECLWKIKTTLLMKLTVAIAKQFTSVNLNNI